MALLGTLTENRHIRPVPDSRGSGSGGSVFLLGAGPGDPSLLTIRGAKILARSEIVFYDALIPPSFLAVIPESARLIPVGRRKGHVLLGQSELHRRLVRASRSYRTVVRLKGGDPTFFGRVGEEVQALQEAGVAVQIIPGVTAASAAASLLGVSLTERGLSSSCVFITAHGSTIDGSGRWNRAEVIRASQGADTIAIYMGATIASKVGEALIESGRSERDPAAIVAKAFMAGESWRVLSLRELAMKGIEESITRPALLLSGPTLGRLIPHYAEECCEEGSVA